MSRKRYSITLSDGTKTTFVLNVGRRSRMAMTFVEGELNVRVPYGCTNREINEFILSNTDWINEQLVRLSSRVGLPVTFANGERIKLLGKELVIEYRVSDRYFEPFIEDDKLVAAVREQGSEGNVKASVEAYIARLAEKEITESMRKMSALTGLSPQKVTIKSMTSRWGSCSSAGKIAVNYKVVQFPRECIEYVCIHELCHLKQMNHSEQFWAMVESYCPQWKKLRDMMK